MTLDQLEINDDARIQSIHTKNTALRRRIMDMGLIPGARVTMIKTAPLGDPLEIHVSGSELAVRKHDAEKIQIEKTDAIESNQKPPEKAGKSIHIALIGNPNCGKTTLFNRMTNKRMKTGNFPGVTVERKDAPMRMHPEAVLTDLPGIYSLSAYSPEEIVTERYLLCEKPDCIINIVDAAALPRGLNLTMQLLSLSIPTVIAVNMMDELKKSGGKIDCKALETHLSAAVIPISALTGEGVKELEARALHEISQSGFIRKSIWADFKKPEADQCLKTVSDIFSRAANNAHLPSAFLAERYLESGEKAIHDLTLSEGERKLAENAVQALESKLGKPASDILSEMRSLLIQRILTNTVFYPPDSLNQSRSKRIDRILTGKYTGIPIFSAIMLVIFFIAFGPLGSRLSDSFSHCLFIASRAADHLLTALGVHNELRLLIVNGAVSGAFSVLGFLPVILLLFFFLSLMEDSGYMARIAFIMDKPMRKIGLSGKSIVPLLMGFGCTVPAVLSSRTISDKRERILTVLFTPFMSCSAKLPIYSLFASAFFPKGSVFVIIGLYLFSVILGISVIMLSGCVFQNRSPSPFLMELPFYRMPSMENVLKDCFHRLKDFFARTFTIIFLTSLIVWTLMRFDLRLHIADNPETSLLAHIGLILSPIFRPLGLDRWQICAAVITGFSAKENVVSTLSVLASSSGASPDQLFTPSSALIFLVFCLLYTPCAAAISAVRRELGGRWALFTAFFQTGLAWFICLALSFVLKMAGGMG
ncbi:MAG: ferrous iron transport protein B [Clostridia bacterium]|nr:ferrous iron transport protein B [Clostridia bacterium]